MITYTRKAPYASLDKQNPTGELGVMLSAMTEVCMSEMCKLVLQIAGHGLD